MQVSRRRSLFAFVLTIFIFISSHLSVAQEPANLASQISLLNHSIEITPRPERPARDEVSSDLLNVLQTRQKLVEQLIRTNPAAARSVMLSPSLAEQLTSASPAYAAAIESVSHWSGTLESAVADDFEHGRSTTHWYVHSGDHRIELFFATPQNPARQLHRSVVVSGVGTLNTISVESIHPDIVAAGQPPAGLNCTSTGVENVAVLIMNQPTGGTPYPDPSFATSSYWTQNYFGATAKSANNFWQEASFDLTSGTGTFFTSGSSGPLTFTSPEDCTNTDALATDAISAAEAGGVDFSTYSRISIIYPVSSCTFGGLGTVGCYSKDGRVDHAYSLTWIPVISYYPTNQVLWGIVAHELGHNLGLHHSSSLDFGNIPLGAIDYADPYPNAATASPGEGVRVEYGDPYTVMGGGSYTCGGQYTAFNKAQYLTWMNHTTDVMELTSSGGSFKVTPFENSTGLRALRVLRDPLSSSWIWMEYRQPLGEYDSDFNSCDLAQPNFYNGAAVYYESPYSEDGHLFLLDMTPSSVPNNFDAAALTPGHSWSDPYSLLTLSVTAADSTGVSITTSFDQPCATLQVSSSGVFSDSAGSGMITVTAPNTCSWTASTVDSWITINSGSSGTGNGTVNFNLTSNASNVAQRNGYITVQRQSVPIAQKGTATFVGNLSPTLQSGLSGVPVFTFNNPAGVANISYVTSKINDIDCEVETVLGSDKATWFMFLLDPSTNQFSPSIIPGQSLTASNAYCTLNGATSTVSTSGNQFQLGVSLTFPTSFAGSYRVTSSVCDTTGCSSDIPVGTFQVGQFTPAISSVTSSSGKQGASVPVTVVGTNTHFSGSSTVSVSGTGVTVSGVSASSTTQLAATFAIDPNATASARTVTVTTGTEVVTSSFTVNASGQVQLSSASVTFPNQNPFTTSTSLPVTLTNNGHAALNISSITGSSQFGITHNCGTSVGVNATCTLNITFTPSEIGTRVGTITIADDSPSAPHTISLSGYGNLILPLSRPGRPVVPASVNRGIITNIIVKTGDVKTGDVKTGDLKLFDASELICSAPGKLSCSVVPLDANPGSFTVAVNAENADPGHYVLYITAPAEISAPMISVPIEVDDPSSDDRP